MKKVLAGMGIPLADSGHGISGRRSCGAGRNAGASDVPAVEHREDQPQSEGAEPDAAGGGPAAVLEIAASLFRLLLFSASNQLQKGEVENDLQPVP